MSIVRIISEIISQELNVSDNDFVNGLDTTFDELGCDELEFADLILILDKQFGVNNDSNLLNLESVTVRDLVQVYSKLLSTSPSNDELMDREKSSGPRRLHYNFAYKLIPKILKQDSDYILEVTHNNQLNEFLYSLWNDLHSQLNCDYIDPSDIKHVKIDFGTKAELILIQMPEPQKFPEAYYLAILYAANGVHYATLESTPGNKSVLCIFVDFERCHSTECNSVLSVEDFIKQFIKELKSYEMI